MKLKERPQYKAKYQMEIAVELTGRTKEAIYKLMKRKELTLSGAIRYYLNGGEEENEKVGFCMRDEELGFDDEDEYEV